MNVIWGKRIIFVEMCGYYRGWWDSCGAAWRTGVAEVCGWAETEVAAANARVDGLERAIKEGRRGQFCAEDRAWKTRGWPAYPHFSASVMCELVTVFRRWIRTQKEDGC